MLVATASVAARITAAPVTVSAVTATRSAEQISDEIQEAGEATTIVARRRAYEVGQHDDHEQNHDSDDYDAALSTQELTHAVSSLDYTCYCERTTQYREVQDVYKSKSRRASWRC